MMNSSETSHRTRSKAAPDWTVEESLTLATEINTVESEWGSTLPSFQKWQQIVENCNALGVNRNLNQCKRNWDALLADYRLAKARGGSSDSSFPAQLFDAIDEFVADGKNKSVAGGNDDEEEGGMGTDRDSDPEDIKGRLAQVQLQTGSKKQRKRMKRKKGRVQRLNPWGYFTSTNIKPEEPSRVEEKPGILNGNIAESTPDDIEKEQQLATILWENTIEINSILERNLVDDEAADKLTDPRDAEIRRTRCEGDKLIEFFTKMSTTLNELCELAEDCN